MGSWITKVIVQVGDDEVELTKEQFMELSGEVRRLKGELRGELQEMLVAEPDVTLLGNVETETENVVGGEEGSIKYSLFALFAQIRRSVRKAVLDVQERLRGLKKTKQE